MHLKPSISKSVDILAIHHKLGHLAHAKSIWNLQKYFIYSKWDTCYTNSSNFGTSCMVLATVPNQINNFHFFFSECSCWTHTQLGVPQTWSSVNPLDHKKAYKTVPLQILVSVHLTQQYQKLRELDIVKWPSIFTYIVL